MSRGVEVDTADPPPGSSRRALLAAAPAALAASALAVAGCGADARPRGHRLAPAAAQQELAALNRLRSIELLAVEVYTAAIPRLSRRFYWTARQLLADEVAHAAELYGLIHHRGGTPTAAAARYDLGIPRTPRQALELFSTLEHLQVSSYLRAIPQMPSGRVRAVLGAILASDAQHQAVVRQGLGEAALSGPYVTG